MSAEGDKPQVEKRKEIGIEATSFLEWIRGYTAQKDIANSPTRGISLII